MIIKTLFIPVSVIYDKNTNKRVRNQSLSFEFITASAVVFLLRQQQIYKQANEKSKQCFEFITMSAVCISVIYDKYSNKRMKYKACFKISQ